MTFYADYITSSPQTFQRDRQLLLDQGIQEGVVGIGDLKVAQRAAGANMSVDIAPGFAFVQIDTGTRNGVSHITSDALANVVVAASHASLPRIDQIILRYNDTSLPTGAGNTPTPEVLAGTPTSGATLDNRNGAAALPNDCLRLADVLVPAASSSVITGNIRDRRPWARGAYNRIIRNANDSAGNDFTTTINAVVMLSTASLDPRIECSGAPLRLTFRGRHSHSVSGGRAWYQPAVDDSANLADFGISLGAEFPSFAQSVASENGFNFSWDWTPTPGSHKIGIAWRTDTATASLLCRNNIHVAMVVEEILRPNTNNN